MISDVVRTRFAPSPTGFYMLEVHVLHFLIIYFLNVITVNLFLELKILI